MEPLDTKNSKTPTHVYLHPQSDACFVIENEFSQLVEFHILSSVLIVASPYFERLLGPFFSEGNSLKLGKPPRIFLVDDEVDAMEIILSILHHQPTPSCNEATPEVLASVAVHSDKYSCNRVLQPWVSRWLLQARSTATPDDYGLLLSAAYLFESDSDTLETSRSIIKELTRDFDTTWSQHEIISRVPQELRGTMLCFELDTNFVSNGDEDAIADRISDALDQLHLEMQAVEERLQGQKEVYHMPFQLCPCCGRMHPENAGQCRPCRNTTLYGAVCTSGQRIGDLFDTMRRHQLWPSVGPFNTCSVAEIVGRMAAARVGLRHRCKQGKACPLVLEIGTLSSRAESLLQQVEGITLKSLGTPA
ncbi:hypothetical protein S40288_08300 [Stachybotrys chartarum IBT 40288]|nr:hypothetical protein S40288_08300 [Stachybotrys chartarum IBT 40288]